MKRTSSLLLLGLSGGLPCRASDALPGVTGPVDDPACAYACTGSLSSFALECSVEDHDAHGGHSHGASTYTSPGCRANNTPYLTTLAWCLHTKCAPYDVLASRLETIWEQEATTDPSVLPKWSYTEALLNVVDSPTRQLAMGDTINATLLAPESWDVSFNTAVVMAHSTMMVNALGCVFPFSSLLGGDMSLNPFLD